MITYGTLGSMLKRKLGGLRAKAKAANSDPDRVNFKNRSSYMKHERSEPKDEKKVETQIVGKP
jgi:hypothetical protein